MKPAAKREAVRHVRGTYAVSLRRACRLMQIGMSSYYYKAKPIDDGTLREALKETAAKREALGLQDAHRSIAQGGLH